MLDNETISRHRKITAFAGKWASLGSDLNIRCRIKGGSQPSPGLVLGDRHSLGECCCLGWPCWLAVAAELKRSQPAVPYRTGTDPLLNRMFQQQRCCHNHCTGPSSSSSHSWLKHLEIAVRRQLAHLPHCVPPAHLGVELSSRDQAARHTVPMGMSTAAPPARGHAAGAIVQQGATLPILSQFSPTTSKQEMGWAPRALVSRYP